MAQWKMKRVLDRNRSLLKAWSEPRNQRELNEEPAQWLVRRGFNFHYTPTLNLDQTDPWPSCASTMAMSWVATGSGRWASNRIERYLRRFLDFVLPDLRFFS